jgi:hypothetical protein
VRNALYPTTTEFAYFQHVSDGRRKPARPRLTALTGQVRRAYQQYSTATTLVGLTPIGPLPDPDVAALKSNYEALGLTGNAHIRAQVRGRSSICCYCGFRDATDLDHYLPRTIYPEFSVLTENLVPACGTCNNRKRAYFRTTGGRPLFLHAYRDVLATTGPYLTAAVNVAANAVTVTVDLDQTVFTNPAVGATARTQFDFLRLGPFLSEQGLKELRRYAHLVHGTVGQQGITRASVLLNQVADSYAMDAEIDDSHTWVVTLRAAASNPAFMNGGYTPLL